MSKRSPILGYNHNVRYRGLVFHVQTEDSGVASPHLFTHLFHHGVIVSSRKLVYDAGSAEESIKSLMQAQHKVTLKDLRRGHFDDKIDSYLGGTPGLLPRGAEDLGDRAGEVELAPSQGTAGQAAVGAPTEQAFDDLSAPMMIVETEPASSRSSSPPPIPRRPTTDRPLAPGSRPTQSSLDATLRTAAPAFDSSPEIDLSPEIEIQLELDDHGDSGATRRTTRDTEIQMRPTLEVLLDDHTRPTLGTVNEEARRATISDGIPGMIRPSSPSQPAPDSRRLGDRPSTINAATLPPARPIPRPQSRPALSQPQVMQRPVPPDERNRREPEAVEVYSPAPPSAELPQGERPGQYAQHKKVITRVPSEGPKGERSGGVPIPAGLGRPQRIGPPPTPPAVKPNATPPPGGAIPSVIPPESSPRSSGHTEPLRGRVPTPSRTSPSGSTSGRAAAPSSSGVVMTRPAVIVGAPAKSVGTVPRIRKAREDEGRGFGQGLISEKSLDEVILAYLSEDADEK